MPSTEDHFQIEDYVRWLSEGRAEDSFPQRVHRHLMTKCEVCADAWSSLGPVLRTAVELHLGEVRPSESLQPQNEDGYISRLEEERLEETYAKLSHLRRRARKQLSELRVVPREERASVIESASLRFRSRFLAEALIDEAKAVIREDPAEAESFASLVPRVLDWAKGGDGPSWARILCLRAEAHRANALRVRGCLVEAQSVFDRIRQPVGQVGDLSVLAEVCSLEGSLCIGMRRFDAADLLLERASVAFAVVGDHLGMARTQIKMANLCQTRGEPERVLELLQNADSQLGDLRTPYLTVFTVNGRVNALCDLGRPLEARLLLHQHLDAYEEEGGAHTAGILRCLEGRIALGLDEFASAEDHFASCRLVMSHLGRDFDAALTGLYLAETYLRSSQFSRLYRLSAELMREFVNRRVVDEASRAFYLFRRAVASKDLTVDVIDSLRSRVQDLAAA